MWQLGKKITVSIYSTTKNFPKDEVFGITAQMRRAAISIISNIAEGFVRNHSNEQRQFLYIALSSCAELEGQVDVCLDLGYIPIQTHTELLEKLNHETRMIRTVLKKL